MSQLVSFDEQIRAYASRSIDWEQLMTLSARKARNTEKTLGAVYTPLWIVEKLIDESDITAADVIWEPSCGHGAFVIPILERICGDWSYKEAIDWMNGHLFATDIDAQAIDVLRRILVAWVKRTYDVWVDEDVFTSLIVSDALRWEPPCRVDIAIGNPPYVRFQNLSDDGREFLSIISPKTPYFSWGM